MTSEAWIKYKARSWWSTKTEPWISTFIANGFSRAFPGDIPVVAVAIIYFSHWDSWWVCRSSSLGFRQGNLGLLGLAWLHLHGVLDGSEKSKHVIWLLLRADELWWTIRISVTRTSLIHDQKFAYKQDHESKNLHVCSYRRRPRPKLKARRSSTCNTRICSPLFLFLLLRTNKKANPLGR